MAATEISMSMQMIFDSRWVGDHGIGRFAGEISSRIKFKSLRLSGSPSSPMDPIKLTGVLLRNSLRERIFVSPGYNGPLLATCPYIITVHDLNHVDRLENSNFSKRMYYRFILKRVCLRAAAVMTVSEYSRQRISEWMGLDEKRIFNVGNGVSSVFSVDGEKNDFGFEYVLCVSNRRGHKNEEGALRGFLKAGLPEHVRLVFTGVASGGIVNEIERLQAHHRVHFTGRLSEESLAALYRGAQLLLFPSFYEGFGLPIVEAFASGTPVICSNVTSMPEIAGEAALLIDPYSDESIAAAARELYYSEHLRDVLKQKGIERVAYFNWDAVAARVSHVIDSCQPGSVAGINIIN